MKNSFPNPIKSAPFTDKDLKWSAPWLLFFQNQSDKSFVSDLFNVVSNISASGTDFVVDKWPKADGNFVVIFVFIQSGSNIKGGTLMASWTDNGTLVSRHGQNEIMDIGDTSDQIFSFNYDSTRDHIQLLSTSTEAYTVSLLRIVL